MALKSVDVNKWRKTWRKKKSGALLSIVGIMDINEVIKEAVKRAYAPSIQNTAIKEGKYGSKKLKVPKDKCVPIIEEALKNIMDVNNECDFEKWEEELAKKIRKIYKEDNHIVLYTYGNAQKWINMSIKYIFSADSVDFNKKIFEVCYLPIDRAIQNAATRDLGVRPLNEAWSKCDDWEEIKNYQKSIKDAIGQKTHYGPRLWWECNVW